MMVDFKKVAFHSRAPTPTYTLNALRLGAKIVDFERFRKLTKIVDFVRSEFFEFRKPTKSLILGFEIEDFESILKDRAFYLINSVLCSKRGE